MAEGVWKGVYPQVFGRSKQLSQNKFFDPSTPSLLVGDHPWWVTILWLVADGVWKGVHPQVFGRSKQLSLNKFFL